MRDFTLDAYMSVICTLQGKGIPIYGIAKWLDEKPACGAVIRHDVDRRPLNALRMAEAEALAGVHSTYYFRVIGSAYDTDVMRSVHALGHEVGYHYEDLALERGNLKAALASFENHLNKLREFVPIRTAAMHGSPMSPHNNLEMWKHAEISKYDLAGEAFLTVDYRGMYYFTDTGRSWGATSTNLRDRPSGVCVPERPVKGSAALCDFIKNNPVEKIAISAHPERWDSTLHGWLAQGAKDSLINCAKVLISRIR